ncbi:MAG: amidohydrolase family protein [Myxococcota bacterium]
MSTVLRGGTLYDGTGAPGRAADVWLADGVVRGIGPHGMPVPDGTIEVDARGCWVTPGFFDGHTHYDAELEAVPSLSESVRHGVTSVIIGSCGLSMACGDPTALADMFCRVEGIPRADVLPLFERVKDWETPEQYLDHLDGLPLGPNVACLLGHSTLRAHVMGLGRSLEPIRPEPAELDAMEATLRRALDAGYIGLSINTLPWDKMDGEAFRSRPTPSTFASWREYRRLASVLRERERVLQALPNISTKVNAVLFFTITTGVGRKGLKTLLISMVDAKADRLAFRAVGAAANAVNRWLGGNLRFQSLPNPFDMWVDGMEVPVLEEIAAGTELLHEQDPEARRALLRDPAYRRRFRRQWNNPILGKAYHRDLYEAVIREAPDPALVGRSFGAIADERGHDAIDTFLDLQAEHGTAMRWYSVLGNDRPQWLQWIMAHDAVQIGFSDAGAHLRNFAYYNFPLRMLKRVRDAERSGRPFMTVERAVHRLTAEIADWLGVEGGTLREGARADVVIVDPTGLDDAVEQMQVAPIPGFTHLDRLVRRNDAAVRGVWIGGEHAWAGSEAAPALGTRKLGKVLRAGLRTRPG